MTQATVLQPVEVVRNEDGYFLHPAVSHFWNVEMAGYEHCTREQWQAFEKRNGIETAYDQLEHYPLDHPVYVSYFDNEDTDISAWQPTPPPGDGWFLITIGDSEDGPYATFARPRGE